MTNQMKMNDVVAQSLGFDSTLINFNLATGKLPTQMKIVRQACRRLFLHKADFFLREFRTSGSSGKIRWFSLRGQVANIDAKGHVTRLNGSIDDITERIRDLENRKELELKMMRVQKMEAKGE